MAVKNLRVYDTETTGLSHHSDQIIQFAGVAVDSELNVIKGEDIVLDIRLRPDVVPSPHAFAVHGISIKDTLSKGITEFEAASRMRNWFMQSRDSMMTGYNTLRFDDEQVRNTLFRSLLDTYEHEWKNGNTRSDIIRLTMMVYALRPELLNWTTNAEGRTSMKLGDMAAANGIVLDNAHDARYDVNGTIDLMRIIRNGNKGIWEYFLSLSDKSFVKSKVEALDPLVLIDPYLSREQSHMTMALPIIYDLNTSQKMLCVDLRYDPTELMSLPADEIRRRLFTPTAELAEGESLSGMIRDMTVNKQPLIVEASIFKKRPDIVSRASLDMDSCMRHAELIKKDRGFRERLQMACVAVYPPCDDVYQGIYSLGLISRDESSLRAKARGLEKAVGDQAPLPNLVNLDPLEFSTRLPRDPLRLFDLTTRAKWANFSDQVIERDAYKAADIQAWTSHLNRVWFDAPTAKNAINLAGFRSNLSEVRASLVLNDVQEKALLELEQYVNDQVDLLKTMDKLCEDKTKLELSASVANESPDQEQPIDGKTTLKDPMIDDPDQSPGL